MSKAIYQNLLENGIVKRNGYKELLDWLIQKGFFELPAEIEGFHSEEGGLAKHAAEVHTRLILEYTNELAMRGMSRLSAKMEESIAIIALFHELDQIDSIAKQDGKFIEGPEYLHLPKQQKTLYLIRNFMNLTAVETEAITYIHDGNDDCFRDNSLALLAYNAHKKAKYLDSETYKDKKKAFSFKVGEGPTK